MHKKEFSMQKIIVLTICLLFSLCHADHMQDMFTNVYDQNFWADKESLSGPGSNLKQTETLRNRLQAFFDLFDIKTIVDAACGDYHWMKALNYPFEQYIGIDIVPELIVRNQTLYADSTTQFQHANVVQDTLPKVDLIICRDCFVHLFIEDIKETIRNFKKSGSKYLLMTTFRKVRRETNTEIERLGWWRPLNMTLAPFNLPEPILYLNEGCTEANPGDKFDDKCLGLWRLDDITI